MHTRKMLLSTAAIAAALALGVAAQAQRVGEERWITVGDDGWWTQENGQEVDLSSGWKVVQHVETGRERLVPQAFGTASLTIETIPFSAFLPSSSGVNWNQDLLTGYGERGGASPTTFAYAPLQVQSGLRVESIELEYCDDTPDGRLILSLSQCPAFDEDGCVGFASVDTGEAEAPGCTLKTDVLDEPHTIDNFSNVYKFNLSDTSSGGGSLRVRAVRVFLRRQVSPAPSTATFDDVPTTHPFFQHIEAFAAAGIQRRGVRRAEQVLS